MRRPSLVAHGVVFALLLVLSVMVSGLVAVILRFDARASMVGGAAVISAICMVTVWLEETDR